MKKQFRFQDLDVWKHAAAFSPELFRLADKLEKRRLYRFAEQLRAATLSITNNIAEGSGSVSNADFANFLNTARRSTLRWPISCFFSAKTIICKRLIQRA